jgi:leucyl aminopeptidase (aminopeptidase T)
MTITWSQIARRIVEGVGVQPGELIQVRDGGGRLDALLEILLAVERAGATPLPLLLPADYLERLWREVPPEHLAAWDRHRAAWSGQTDRVIRLEGAVPDPSAAPPANVRAWQEATHRLVVIEEAKVRPYILAAIPNAGRARQLGLTLEALEILLLPALVAGAAELRQAIAPALAAVQAERRLTIVSGPGYELRLDRDKRSWLVDDGEVDAEDARRGAVSSNLPSGSIYTTVLESETEGRLWLPQAGPAREATLQFERGRIAQIEAAGGAEALNAWLDSHSGEPRRISHIGLGLNPYLARLLGWLLVDRMVPGHLFIALGENRYMGGQNVSSLNEDYDIPGATLLAGQRVVVEAGKLVV